MSLRKVFLIPAVLVCTLPLFAAKARSPKEFFPSLYSKTDSVYPVDSELGAVSSSTETPEYQLIAKALSSEFNLEWTETYLHKDTRAALTKLISPGIEGMLPCSDFIISNSVKNGDNSTSVSVHFVSYNLTVSLVIADNAIYALSYK